MPLRVRRRTDLVVAVVALLLGAGTLAVLPREVPGSTLAAIGDPLSSAFFPELAGICLLALGAVLGVQALVGEADAAKDGWRRPARPGRLLAVAAVFAVYAVAIDLLGMLSASGLMIAALAYLFGWRRPLSTLALAVVIPLLIHLMFERVLLVILPRGILI